MDEKYYIYRFLDEEENILYIGRTNDLERRILAEHFTDLGHLPMECYKSIDKIEYTEVLNESEEVAYEAVLINKIKPSYNTQFKDEGEFNINLPEFDWHEFKVNEKYFEYLKSKKNKIIEINNALMGVLEHLTWEQDESKEGYYIKTGFRDIDKYTKISPSDLILLGSVSSMGKTSYAITMTLNLIEKDKKVLYLNLKDSVEEITERMLSCSAQIFSYELSNHLSDSDWSRLSPAVGKLGTSYLDLSNLGYEDKTIDIIVDVIQKKSYDFIIIDELEAIHSKDPVYIKDKTKHIMNRLKSLAVDIKTPIMLLHQISGDIVHDRVDKRPRLKDLKYDSLRSFPDVIKFLYRDDYYNPDSEKQGLLEVMIPKNKINSNIIAELAFQKEYSRIIDLVKR